MKPAVLCISFRGVRYFLIWFTVPRLLPCCPQLVQVKPCLKCPCTPSESNLGCIAAILIPCVIWGLDRKTRNCLSLAAVPKGISQPGMMGTSCKTVPFHPWWENAVGNQGQSAWQYPSRLTLLQQKLCPVTEILILEQFLALLCSLIFLGCFVVPIILSGERRSPVGYPSLDYQRVSWVVSPLPRGAWSLLVSLQCWPLSVLLWQIAPFAILLWWVFPNIWSNFCLLNLKYIPCHSVLSD